MAMHNIKPLILDLVEWIDKNPQLCRFHIRFENIMPALDGQQKNHRCWICEPQARCDQRPTHCRDACGSSVTQQPPNRKRSSLT